MKNIWNWIRQSFSIWDISRPVYIKVGLMSYWGFFLFVVSKQLRELVGDGLLTKSEVDNVICGSILLMIVFHYLIIKEKRWVMILVGLHAIYGLLISAVWFFDSFSLRFLGGILFSSAQIIAFLTPSKFANKVFNFKIFG